MDKQRTPPAGTDLSMHGTGRTSRAIAATVLAAATGHRVVYVTPGPAREAYVRALRDLDAVRTMLDIGGIQGVQTSNYVISFYRDGKVGGTVRFCNMDDQPERINIGLRDGQLFKLVDDHAVAELRAAKVKELEKVAAMEQIALLMEKHGWEAAMPNPATTDTSVTHFYYGKSDKEVDIRTVKTGVK